MNRVLEVIEKRSSIRGYLEQEISEEELSFILNAGLQAPTATNRQEIHFTVCKGNDPVLAELEAEKNRLRRITAAEHNFYYEAPVVIFLSAENGFRWSSVDAGIAVENMSLAAASLGLGSLIIGCVYDACHGEKKDYFETQLQFPEGYEFQIALAVGYGRVEKEPHTYTFDRQVTYK